jgi:hypothetical protein
VERLSVHVWHRVVEEAAGVAGVVQRKDVGVLQACSGPDLLVESFGSEDGREIRAQDLERDWAEVLEIAGEVYRGHSTAPELSLERVSVGEKRLKEGQRLRHVGRLTGDENKMRRDRGMC